MRPTTPPSIRDLPAERRLASLLGRLEVHQRDAEDHNTLHRAEARLLWFLSDRGPHTLRGIADGLNLEQSTVNRQVNVALAAGNVRRFTEPGQQARLIEPTPEGLAAFEAASARTLGAYDAGLAALGSEAGEFLDLLDRFLDAYGEAVREQPSAVRQPR